MDRKNNLPCGPPFSKAERDFNLSLRDRLVEIGFKVFLP